MSTQIAQVPQDKWRERCLDMLDLMLDGEVPTGFVDLGRNIIADLKAERPLQIPVEEVRVDYGVAIRTAWAETAPPAGIGAAARQIEAVDNPVAPQAKAQELPIAPVSGSPAAKTAKKSSGVLWTPERHAKYQETLRRKAAEKGTAPDPSAAVGLKTCTGCGQVKTLDEFHRKPGGPSGRDSRCRECSAAARKKAGQGFVAQSALHTEPNVQNRVIDLEPAQPVRAQVVPNGTPNAPANVQSGVQRTRDRDALYAAEARYREHLAAGGVISNQFEGELIEDFGLNRTQVMAIRDELLKARTPAATAKADRNGRKWDTTPPYMPGG